MKEGQSDHTSAPLYNTHEAFHQRTYHQPIRWVSHLFPRDFPQLPTQRVQRLQLPLHISSLPDQLQFSNFGTETERCCVVSALGVEIELLLLCIDRVTAFGVRFLFLCNRYLVDFEHENLQNSWVLAGLTALRSNISSF